MSVATLVLVALLTVVAATYKYQDEDGANEWLHPILERLGVPTALLATVLAAPWRTKGDTAAIFDVSLGFGGQLRQGRRGRATSRYTRAVADMEPGRHARRPQERVACHEDVAGALGLTLSRYQLGF